MDKGDAASPRSTLSLVTLVVSKGDLPIVDYGPLGVTGRERINTAATIRPIGRRHISARRSAKISPLSPLSLRYEGGNNVATPMSCERKAHFPTPTSPLHRWTLRSGMLGCLDARIIRARDKRGNIGSMTGFDFRVIVVEANKATNVPQI